MTYDITHTTTYDYTAPVSVSYHTLRLHPRARPGQSDSGQQQPLPEFASRLHYSAGREWH